MFGKNCVCACKSNTLSPSLALLSARGRTQGVIKGVGACEVVALRATELARTPHRIGVVPTTTTPPRGDGGAATEWAPTCLRTQGGKLH